MMGPPYRTLREDEDWSHLRSGSPRRDWLDPIKYIPLGDNPDYYLTIGGQIRQGFEYFHNEMWGAGPAEDNRYSLQRYMMHTDFHLGKRVRVFTQLKSGLSFGRIGGPRPIVDQDKLDINQAWVDLNLSLRDDDKPGVTLRLGRQEMQFGNGRLVSAREGPTVRAGFDGARVIVNSGTWRVDGFAVKPVETTPGFFDDPPQNTDTFWGMYGSGIVADLPFKVDAYYLGLARKFAISNEGIAPETRHTVGTRIWKGGTPFAPGQGWDYEFETAFQFGNVGPGMAFGPAPFARKPIRAWTVSSAVGYTFEGVKLRPRVGLNTGIASGDKDPQDQRLQTFFAPYPSGHYFGAIQHNGPLNIQGLRPAVTLSLPSRATLEFDSFFFWRQSTRDGIYAIPGFPLRQAGPSRARYIGTQPQAAFIWPATQHLVFIALHAHFIAGPFLRESPPGKNLAYLGLYLDYQF